VYFVRALPELWLILITFVPTVWITPSSAVAFWDLTSCQPIIDDAAFREVYFVRASPELWLILITHRANCLDYTLPSGRFLGSYIVPTHHWRRCITRSVFCEGFARTVINIDYKQIKINHRIYTYRKWLEFAFKQTNWSNPTQWEGIILQGVTASGTHLEGGCCFHYTYLTTFKTHGMNPWEELLCSGMQISTAECKGAKLMLLKNFEVELGLWMEPVEQWWTFATKNAMGRAQMQMKLNMEVCFTMKICSMLLLTFQLVQYQRVRNSLPTNLTPHISQQCH